MRAEKYNVSIDTRELERHDYIGIVACSPENAKRIALRRWHKSGEAEHHTIRSIRVTK